MKKKTQKKNSKIPVRVAYMQKHSCNRFGNSGSLSKPDTVRSLGNMRGQFAAVRCAGVFKCLSEALSY